MDLDRRHLLGLVGVGALAGCLDDPDQPSSDSTSSTDGREDYPNSSGAAGTQLPSCPDYGERVDRVICDDADGSGDEPIILEPSTRTVEIGSPIEFTLRNDSDARLATNFYNWRVDKHVDGRWNRVAPMGHNDPLMFVDPGDTHTWTVTPTNDGIDEGAPVEPAGGTETIALAGVGPGAYAFRARGWVDGERSEKILAFAATFELEGESLELAPTNAIEDVEREEREDGPGDRLVASSSRGDPDDEYHRSGAFELEVVEEPVEGEARSVITEQLVRQDRLRDAVALVRSHDVSAVRIEEYDGTGPVFGRDGDEVYEYQGAFYRVRTRELEDR